MCLTIEIIPNQKIETEIRSISNVDGALFVSAGRNWRGKFTGNIIISQDGEGSCACGMLTDDADWDNEYWDMHQESLSSLAITVEKLFELFPNGFEFIATWAGDQIEKSKYLGAIEFISLIHSNRIETKTKYVIQSAEQSASQRFGPKSRPHS